MYLIYQAFVPIDLHYCNLQISTRSAYIFGRHSSRKLGFDSASDLITLRYRIVSYSGDIITFIHYRKKRMIKQANCSPNLGLWQKLVKREPKKTNHMSEAKRNFQVLFVVLAVVMTFDIIRRVRRSRIEYRNAEMITTAIGLLVLTPDTKSSDTPSPIAIFPHGTNKLAYLF